MRLIEIIMAFIVGVSAPLSPTAAPDYGVEGFTAETVEVQVAPAPAQVAEVVADRDESPVASRSEVRQPVQVAEEAPVEPVEQAQTNPEPSKAPELSAAVQKPAAGGILGIAASYVGYPYSLPSNPPATFDCSSYVAYVFAQAGRSVPSSVNGLKSIVTPVSNPQPGDLIFYHDFHHVGIYAGNGMTYEALNPSAGVVYGPLVSQNVWYGRP